MHATSMTLMACRLSLGTEMYSSRHLFAAMEETALPLAQAGMLSSRRAARAGARNYFFAWPFCHT